MKKRILIVMSALITVFCLLAAPLIAEDWGLAEHAKALPEDCSSIIVGKSASATGEVLFGHNEDNGDNVMLQYVVPRMTFKAGDLASFEESCAKIPQVEQTLSYLWSETRAAWSASFSDFFINEKGVAVASNNCRPSREDQPELTEGGIAYGLRVLIAQRATSAREGVEIAARLISQYGYASSGRAYEIVDKNEAWVLEVVNGKHYVARRVADDEVFFIPNFYTIHEVDLSDHENYIASPDLITYAIDRGWYTPKTPGDYSDFDFAQAYQDPKANQDRNIVRSKNALRLLLGKDPTDTDIRSFAIKAPRKLGIEDLKRVLRSHYEGTTDDLSHGYSINPHRTGVRTICSGTTMESVIVQFREQPEFTCIWRATLNPCTSPYVPWYLGITKVPDGYGWLDPKTGMASHFKVPVGDLMYRPSRAWWAFQDVQDLADYAYGDIVEQIQSKRDALEKRWADAQAKVEAKAYALYKEDPEMARAYLTAYTNEQAGLAWRSWRDLFDSLLKP
ncbi:MAG: C69 family dipeptidase [Rectinema sp.]